MKNPKRPRHPSPPPSALLDTSITRKTQSTIILALILLLAALYLTLRLVVLSSFDAVERRYADQSLAHARRAIADQLALLDRTVVDYSRWDDTYSFLKGELDEYPASNFTDVMFSSNQLDLVILLDESGSVAYERMLGEKGDLAPAERAGVVAAILGAGAAADLPEDQPRHTVVMTPPWPLMLSAHQVLRSDGSGPSDGVFIMGRWVDGELAAELGARLGLDVSFLRLDDAGAESLAPEVLTLIEKPESGSTLPLDAQHLGSYSIIADAAGRPVVLSRVTSDRPIWATGQQTILVTLAIFVVAGVTFILCITFLLNRIVLSRLQRLIEGVRLIGVKQDLARRVDLDSGDELGLLATTINQTMDALELAERERREAEAQRQQMWRDVVESRRNFLATISHELRTPLTPIRGYADLMLHEVGGDLSPEHARFVRAISESSTRLEAMVSDLLTMGQLDAGRIELRVERVAIGAAVQSALAMLDQQIERHGVAVSTAIPQDLPPVRADKQRLDQILTNLLTNAVKYTPRGGRIEVRAAQLADGRVEIAIQDTGIGMSAIDMERLFTPFYRASRVVSEQIGGTGLGLSITRSLVEQHGGTIDVESSPDVGSVFRFTLPVFLDPEAAPPPQASAVAL